MSDRPPKMIPDPDGLNADFYLNLVEGKLCLRHCNACGVTHHPPRYLCASCGSDDVGWTPATGRGRIFSWTVTHRPVDPGWAPDLPWATVVVEMEEGPRLVGGWRGQKAYLVDYRRVWVHSSIFARREEGCGSTADQSFKNTALFKAKHFSLRQVVLCTGRINIIYYYIMTQLFPDDRPKPQKTDSGLIIICMD